MSQPGRPPGIDPRLLAGLSPRPAPPADASGTWSSSPSPSAAGPAPASGTGASVPDAGPVAQAGPVNQAGPTAGGATGHPGVDAVLADLERAEQLPPDQQISTYESVHRTLQETLRSIEQN